MKSHDRAYVDKLSQKVFIAMIKNGEEGDKQTADCAYEFAIAFFWRRYESILKGYKPDEPSHNIEVLKEIMYLDGYHGEGLKLELEEYSAPVENPLKLYARIKYGYDTTAGQDAILKYFAENDQDKKEV